MENSILKNKNCLITGATGGLGKEIAVELAKKGVNLFLTSKKEDLQKLQLEIKKNNNEIIVEYQCVDLRCDDGVKTLIKNVHEKFSSVDILINCAGENHRKPLSESTIEEFDSCMNLNVRAPFVLSKEFSKDMIENKWGRIVNIASSTIKFFNCTF